ncbi:MAG: acyltransferase family protein [Fibrobacter sp.]|nr:acyltransferase family protein [Fibrobacter sp.]
MEENGRDTVFDVMKGIAIIMVVVFHSNLSAVCSHIVCMFHVPLFFIISGYFAKKRTFIEFLRRDAKRIVVPFIFSFFCAILLAIYFDFVLGIDTVFAVFISMLLGSSSLRGTFLECQFPYAGPFWFLWALLWVRILWYFLIKIRSEAVRGLFILLIGLMSYALNSYASSVPWSILSAFGALSLYYSGYLVKRYDLIHSRKDGGFWFLCFVFSLYCLSFSSIYLHDCTYGTFFVVNVLGCLGCFAGLYVLVDKFNSSFFLWKTLNFLGRYSLVAFCIHGLDHCFNTRWLPLQVYEIYGVSHYDRLLVLLVRLGIVFLGTYLVSRTHFIKEKIFYIK